MTSVSETNRESKYKWYIMVLMALTGCFFVAMPQMCMPVLFKEISQDLGLDLVQIGVIWGTMPLAGLFVIFLGGLLSDKFGTKKVLVIGCFLTGIAGIGRGLSDSFTTLTITMFIFGILQVITSPALVRACSLWFSGKHLGLSNGVLSMSMGFGFLVSSMISATVLSPLLGGWRNVLIAYGIISIIISVLWFFTRSKPEQTEAQITEAAVTPAVHVSIKESIMHVIKIKQLWILGAIMMLQTACVQGTMGYLSIYLQDTGWNPTAADGALATFHGLSTVFAIPIALIAGKYIPRIRVLFIAIAMTAIGVSILIFTNGPGVWVAMIIAGMVRDGFMAAHMTIVLQAKGVGLKYAGTAMGLTQTIARLGEIVSPPLGNSLAGINPQYPFILWASFAVMALFVFFFLRGGQEERLPVE